MSETSDTDWKEAEASRLKDLYERKAGRATTHARFGKETGLGSAGMVWQYLSGHRPLNLQAATRFATALGVKIEDFSPRLAEEVRAAASVMRHSPLIAAEPEGVTVGYLLEHSGGLYRANLVTALCLSLENAGEHDLAKQIGQLANEHTAAPAAPSGKRSNAR